MNKSSQNCFIVNLLNVDWPLFSCLDCALQTKENNPCTSVARVMPIKSKLFSDKTMWQWLWQYMWQHYGGQSTLFLIFLINYSFTFRNADSGFPLRTDINVCKTQKIEFSQNISYAKQKLFSNTPKISFFLDLGFPKYYVKPRKFTAI